MYQVQYELPKPLEKRYGTNGWVDTELAALMKSLKDIY